MISDMAGERAVRRMLGAKKTNRIETQYIDNPDVLLKGV